MISNAEYFSQLRDLEDQYAAEEITRAELIAAQVALADQWAVPATLAAQVVDFTDQQRTVLDQIGLLNLTGTVASVGDLPGGAANGDTYLVSNNGHAYLRLTGVWKDLGPYGGRGGVAMFSVDGEPAADLGVAGDLALDLETGDFYGPKSSEGWGEPVLATGLQAKVAAAEAAKGLAQTAADSISFLYEINSVRYAYGKPVLAASSDLSNRAGWLVTDDAFFYAKFAVAAGVANGLTVARDVADGFHYFSLGAVEGELPLGSAGDVVDSNKAFYFGGKRVRRSISDAQLRTALAVADDGVVFIPRLAMRRVIANGLTFQLGADGFYNLSLGTVEGELPLGSSGVIASTAAFYLQGQLVRRAWTDGAGRVGLAMLDDGTVVIPKAKVTEASPIERVLDAPGYVFETQVTAGRRQLFRQSKATGQRVQVTSLGNNQAPTLSDDKSKLLYTSDREGGSMAFYQPLAGGAEHPVMPRYKLLGIGDSLQFATGAANPATDAPVALLAAEYGLDFLNIARPGATAEGIAAFFGAVDPLVTISGNQIVSGANTITAIDIPFLSSNGSSGTATQKRRIGGVLGTMTKTGGSSPTWAGSYTFTPDAGQSLPVAVPAGVAVTLDATGYDELIPTIRIGRNTISGGAFDTAWSDDAMLRTEQIVTHLKPLAKRFLILPVLNGNYTSEYSGASGYVGIMAHNARLLAEYGSLYVDDRAPLVAAYNPALSGDVTDHGRDVPPTSLRDDNIHPNTAGYAVLYAAQKARIDALGWFA